MIPGTMARVPQATDQRFNDAIRRRTQRSIAQCASGGIDAVNRRLSELDREWDIERVLEANAAMASLMGMVMGATRSRKWFIFPAVVAGFLLQHAVQGWCPPLPLFRRLGVRTAAEIDEERYALKVLRGDFNGMGRNKTSGNALRRLSEAIRR